MERVNDSLETGGARNRDEGGEELALRGTNDSSYSHAAPPLSSP